MAVKLLDLVSSLSKAMDLISPAVVNHHTRVGYVTGWLARRLDLPPRERRDLVLAGLLHDAGALSMKSRLDALQFETDGRVHAEAGFRLLRTCPSLERAARLVRHHHTRHRDLDALDRRGEDAPRKANILNVADRVDVLIRRDREVPGQAESVRGRIQRLAGDMFYPEYLEAFLDVAEDPDFWAGATRPGRHLTGLLPGGLEGDVLDVDGVLEFSRLFSLVIDFRSRFTATHSSGVAETAKALAALHGFAGQDLKLMHIAGNLHDLGKLAVPTELLEKDCKLDCDEFARIKQHAMHSDRIIGGVAGLEQVNEWASSHHERMDGRGYPFQRAGTELSLGARILAVADVFTAITEDRPYRAGMDRDKARSVLREMAADGALDSGVVAALLDNFDAINEERVLAQQRALDEFDTFYAN
jgi:HD-GYP domain-containing protein (c-di-GMP phosphodiesterase class II)